MTTNAEQLSNQFSLPRKRGYRCSFGIPQEKIHEVLTALKTHPDWVVRTESGSVMFDCTAADGSYAYVTLRASDSTGNAMGFVHGPHPYPDN